MNGYLASVLVTGSRTFSDVKAIEAALLDAWHEARQDGWPGIEVIEGTASGSDQIAGNWAKRNREHGVGHHPMPAAWELCAADCPTTPGHRKTTHGQSWCPTAGHRRNQAMVDLAPELVIAFIEPCTSARCTRLRPHDSHGVAHCIRAAHAAGLTVREVRAA